MSDKSRVIVPHYELPEIWDSFTDRERQRVEATLACVPSDAKTALDVGCGDGRFLHLLVPRTHRLVGMDYCFEPLRRVRTNRLQGSATALPFASASFDLVIATEVLEHLGEAEFTATVHEMTRVSRRYVLITVPFRENRLEELCRCAQCARVFHKYGHTRSFELADFQNLTPDLRASKLTTIIPIPKARSLPTLYRIQHQWGGRYDWAETTRCPHCGGNAQRETGNLIGYLVQRIIWRIDKHLPKVEDGWIVALCQKTGQG